jgi:hypothetical protein
MQEPISFIMHDDQISLARDAHVVALPKDEFKSNFLYTTRNLVISDHIISSDTKVVAKNHL